MTTRTHIYLAVLLVIGTFGCRQVYNPPAIVSNTNYLIVEGIINSSNDSTYIKLSRTVPLNNITSIKVEPGAQVMVENDANAGYPLKELNKAAGTYACAPLNLNKTAKYRLRIITSDHKTYLSDFVPVKESPAIDSLGYSTPTDGLKVYINTHDDNNATRYYRYEYAETWMFRSGYSSRYFVSGINFYERVAGQGIYVCWASNSSADIVLASTKKLSKDVLYQVPITLVPAASEKLSIKYSILVKQYALTEDAFNYWQLLKRNTEQLGSIFDAQPSTIQGNIYNINNRSEPVLGYISVGTVQQKRMFVRSQVLPSSWGSDRSAYSHCLFDTVYRADPSRLGLKLYPDYYFGKNPIWIPIEIYVIYPPGRKPDTLGFSGSGRDCVDCTVRGTIKQPAFWQ